MPRRSATLEEVIGRATGIEKCPVVQTNVLWPVPVDQRLNELVGRLDDIGVSRSRVLAALVARAPTDQAELRTLLDEYTRMKAGMVVLQARGPISLKQRRPGRRAL